MSNSKILFSFSPKSKNKKVCCCFSQKIGVLIFSYLSIMIITVAILFDINNKENLIFKISKHLIFSCCMLISCLYYIRSSMDLVYKLAYIGNLFLNFSVIIHMFLFLLNAIFSITISAINKSFNLREKYTANALFCFLFLIFEFYFIWVGYCYTRNLSLGNDALADGQTFDRYIENLAPSSSSKQSSPKSERNLTINQSVASLRKEMQIKV